MTTCPTPSSSCPRPCAPSSRADADPGALVVRKTLSVRPGDVLIKQRTHGGVQVVTGSATTEPRSGLGYSGDFSKMTEPEGIDHVGLHRCSLRVNGVGTEA